MKTKKYVLKKPVLAVQWYKNGDHPNDRCVADENGSYNEGAVVRYFRHPDVAGNSFCECGDTMHYHGWIDQGNDGLIVCPSDYVIENSETGRFPLAEYSVINQMEFRLTYKVDA